MSSLVHFLRCFLCLGFVLFLPAEVRALTVDGGNGRDVGVSPSAAMVDGKPAIAYLTQNGSRVWYVRATDATGTQWGKPLSLEPLGMPVEVSLRVVNGNPAIVYFATAPWFVRALDPRGETWGSPVRCSTGLSGFGGSVVLEIVDGNPAICFMDSSGGQWVRALDPNGSAWGSVSSIDGPGFFSPSLALVEGHPAVAYTGDGAGVVSYRRALDPLGTAWGPRVHVAPALFGPDPSLRVVDGRPAICFFSRDQLFYTRALDAAGSAWRAPLMIDEYSGLGTISPMAVVDGKLSAAYHSSARKELRFAQAADTAGDTAAWKPAVTLDHIGENRGGVTMLDVGGRPALVYYDGAAGSLKYLRALDDDSNGTRWPPDIRVERSGGATALKDNERVLLPLTPPGGTTDVAFTVRNTGGSDLHSLTITFDGPDAGEFSVLNAPAQPVPPAGSTFFTVRHTHGTEGRKIATLHLASNVPGNTNPFDLTIDMMAGGKDPSFETTIATILGAAVQADGRILFTGISGLFSIFPNGSPDPAFFSPVFRGEPPFCIAVQKDGMILVGGGFTHIDGFPRGGLARLHPDGSLDHSFAPPLASTVVCFAMQPDGKILAGSDHNPHSGTSRPRLVRLLPDGTPDAAFNPQPNGTVWCLALQPDGKILAGGNFQNVAGNPASGLARLHANGTFDTALSAIAGEVRSAVLQPDGRILAAESTGGKVMRFFPDGQRDFSLALTGDGGVFDLALQANGQCAVAGRFTTFGGVARTSIARFNASGALDPDFAPVAVTSSHALRLALQADGKMLALPGFASTGAVPLGEFMRLQNDPATARLSISGETAVRWLRSGSAPEVRDVTFDVRPSGAEDWTRLGTAARIPGGWELSGLTLPAWGALRAQGYAGTSVMESVIPFVSNIEAWRLQHFNTSETTGPAADNADPDNDGLTNFTEFAFGLDPTDRTSNTLPEFKYASNSFTATFTAPEGREDLLYSAEWSATMQPGTWSVVPDTGSGPVHLFTLPATSARLFVRFAVSR